MKPSCASTCELFGAKLLKSVFMAALAVAVSPTIQAADKYASGSGNWNGGIWLDAGVPTTAPTASDTANIGNGYNVSLVGSGTAGQIRIGNTTGGFTGTGTLTLTASTGTLNVGGNGSTAIQVGSSDNSNGTLNVGGGVLRNSSVGGWLTVGSGSNSTGTVLLSGGTISVGNNTVLGGSAAGASTGNMTVSGGVITTGTDFLVGRVTAGTNSGSYTQTGGTNAIVRNLRISNATAVGQTTLGTFVISGGNLSVGGNIVVGPTGAGSGSGVMTIGSSVNFTHGANTVFQIGGAGDGGEVVFKLGADDSFNSINLTTSGAASALVLDAGSQITIDGTALVFSEDYDPINLFTFAVGNAPSLASKSNVTFSFIGFDPQFGTPQLNWTSTSLQLTLVPEPSTVVLLLGGLAAGLMTARRSRHRSVEAR